jgi:hypothetical protein
VATLKVFDEFFNELLKGNHVFGTDVYKIRLSNVAPTKATDTVVTSKTAITGGSYADATVTLSITEPTAGTWQLGDTTNVVFTAVSTDFTAFQYAYLHNTSDTDKLVAVLDYGSPVTVTAGNSFTIDPGTNGWIQFVTPSWT